MQNHESIRNSKGLIKDKAEDISQQVKQKQNGKQNKKSKILKLLTQSPVSPTNVSSRDKTQNMEKRKLSKKISKN